MKITSSVGLRGEFRFEVVESNACRETAAAALRDHPYGAEYRRLYGEAFDGSGAARKRLSKEAADRVDQAILQSMAEDPEEWSTSPLSLAVAQPEWTCNLIVNNGLDLLANRTITFSQFANVCVLGTGTTSPSVTDTDLVSEVVRTSNKLSSNTTDNNSTRTRTIANVFDFPAETSNRNYAELGLSNTTTPGGDLTTRALVAGGTVTVLIGQQARVAYNLGIVLGNNYTDTPTVTGDTAGFGSSSGTFAYCTLDTLLMTNDANLTLATGSTIPAFGTTFAYGSGVSCTSSGFDSYTPGTFLSTRYAAWDLSTGNGSSWRSLTSGQAGTSSAGRFAFVFDSVKTKDDTHTLTVTWSLQYGRI